MERLDFPIRDLLRFALPGLLASGYFEALTCAYTGRLLSERPATPVFLGLAVLFGLVSFAVGIHKRFAPWQKKWETFVEDIRKQLEQITAADRLRKDPLAKAIYKIWLEGSEKQRTVRAHLQYQTGIFYGFVAMAFWSGVMAVLCLPLGVAAVLDMTNLSSFTTRISPGLAVGLPVVAVLAMWLFGAHSLTVLRDLSRETLAALQMEDARTEIIKLATEIKATGS